MNARRDPERLIHAFLMEGQTDLADAVYDAVRAGIDQKRQRVVIGPWRVPTVSKLVPIGLGAAAVIAVLLFGSRFIGSPTSNVGGPASKPPASAAPSEASSAPARIAPPPLTQSLASPLHGISLSYPEGWIVQVATEPWADSTSTPNWDQPYGDILYDPVLTDHLFLTIASHPIGDAAPDDWVAEQIAGVGCTESEPIAVDGASGLIAANDCQDGVAVTTAGRGYWIHLRASEDDADAVAPYDRAWFEEVLATVQLHPEDAVDVAPSAAP